MDDREHARLRDEEDRQLYAIRRTERRLERDEHKLARRLEALGKHEREIEIAIEREWRAERWGQDPERLPAWRKNR